MLTISEAVSAVTHACDGPVSPFVIMARAMDLVAQGQASADTAANAAYEALDLLGWINVDADIVSGS